MGSKLELGLVWLRAVAHGYAYSYNNIELGTSFQNNLKRFWIKLNWGLDGCARWRKVTLAIALKVNWEFMFKDI